MKREELELYLNQKVKIELYDEDILEGYLRKTGEEYFKGNPNLFIPKGYYVLTDSELNIESCIFRLSHIIKFEII